MLEIDFLKVASQMELSGVKGRILPLIRKAAKNMAGDRAFRIINLPGTVIEKDGVKSLVTKKGRLCRVG